MALVYSTNIFSAISRPSQSTEGNFWEESIVKFATLWPTIEPLFAEDKPLQSKWNKCLQGFKKERHDLGGMDEKKKPSAVEFNVHLNNCCFNFLTQQCIPTLVDALDKHVIFLPVCKNGEDVLLRIDDVKNRLRAMFVERSQKKFEIGLQWLSGLINFYQQALLFS